MPWQVSVAPLNVQLGSPWHKREKQPDGEGVAPQRAAPQVHSAGMSSQL